MLRIKAIRKKLKIKEEEVCAKVGLPLDDFIGMENGKISVEDDVKDVIAKFYKDRGARVKKTDFTTDVKYKDFVLDTNSNANKVVYRGKEYKSIKDLADKFGVSRSTASKWLNSDRMNPKIETRINGKVYKKSYLETLAKKHNLSMEVVRNRLKKGIPLSPDVKPGKEGKKYDFHGEKLTLKEISEKTGIKLITLSRRAATGIPLDSPILKAGRKEVVYEFEGEDYTLRELAHKLKLPRRVLKGRIEQGTDLGAPYNPRTPRYFYNDDWLSLKEIERLSGLSSEEVQRMADNGELDSGI